MTDFYLNKVLPINSFTQTMTTLRSVMDEEDQLNKLKKIQDKFFEDLDPTLKPPVPIVSDNVTESL